MEYNDIMGYFQEKPRLTAFVASQLKMIELSHDI